jgi:hypothetical protein
VLAHTIAAFCDGLLPDCAAMLCMTCRSTVGTVVTQRAEHVASSALPFALFSEWQSLWRRAMALRDDTVRKQALDTLSGTCGSSAEGASDPLAEPAGASAEAAPAALDESAQRAAPDVVAAADGHLDSLPDAGGQEAADGGAHGQSATASAVGGDGAAGEDDVAEGAAGDLVAGLAESKGSVESDAAVDTDADQDAAQAAAAEAAADSPGELIADSPAAEADGGTEGTQPAADRPDVSVDAADEEAVGAQEELPDLDTFDDGDKKRISAIQCGFRKHMSRKASQRVPETLSTEV